MAQLLPSSTVKEDDGTVLYYKFRGTDEAQNRQDLSETVQRFAQGAIDEVKLYNQKAIMWIRPTKGGFALKYRPRDNATFNERTATLKYSLIGDFEDFSAIYTGPLVDAGMKIAGDLGKVAQDIGSAVKTTISWTPVIVLGGVLVYAAMMARETKKAGA
jgi:hypothetical protein